LSGESPIQQALRETLWLILNQKTRFSSRLALFTSLKEGGWNFVHDENTANGGVKVRREEGEKGVTRFRNRLTDF
jgi:hypothetical protein